MFAISFPLSLFSLPQSYNRCATVWVPLPQGHSDDCIILNRCKYDLVFPCAVTIAVKLGVKVIFIFSLSLIFGYTLMCCNRLWSIISSRSLFLRSQPAVSIIKNRSREVSHTHVSFCIWCPTSNQIENVTRNCKLSK